MVTFRQFRRLVNLEVISQSGMGLECLADCDISDYFDEGFSEREAQDAAIECAHMVLAENDFPMDCIRG